MIIYCTLQLKFNFPYPIILVEKRLLPKNGKGLLPAKVPTGDVSAVQFQMSHGIPFSEIPIKHLVNFSNYGRFAPVPVRPRLIGRFAPSFWTFRPKPFGRFAPWLKFVIIHVSNVSNGLPVVYFHIVSDFCYHLQRILEVITIFDG